MDTKTRNAMYERIEAHGNKLLAIYPKASIKDPVDLCKKLFRLERKMHKANEDACNGTMNDVEMAKIRGRVLREVGRILLSGPEVIINGDPRGYALKIDDSIARSLDIHRDMGGYGIIAPDFRE